MKPKPFHSLWTRFSRKICHIPASFRFQESGWYLAEDTSWSQMEAQPGNSTPHLPDYSIQSIWIRYKNYSDCPIASHYWLTFYGFTWKHTFPILHLFSHSWFIPMILCSTFSQEIFESLTFSYVDVFIIVQNVGNRNLQWLDKKAVFLQMW